MTRLISSSVVTIWKRAAHSFNCMFSFLISGVSHFGIEHRISVLIVQVPDHFLFTFCNSSYFNIENMVLVMIVPVWSLLTLSLG